MLPRPIALIVSATGTRWTSGWLAILPRIINRLLKRPGERPRVLVARLDNIGDVILTTPLLRELRQVFPDAWITLVVRPDNVSLVENCPYINELLTYKRISADGGRGEFLRRFLLLRFVVRRLWSRHFDIAISPRRDTDWLDTAMMCYFSGASRRIGFSESASTTKALENRGYDALFTDVVPGVNAHEVLSNLSLIEYLGTHPASDKLELWPSPADIQWADDQLRQRWAGRRLIAMCVAASASVKQWTVDRFIAVAGEMLKYPDTAIILFGGPGDTAAAEMQAALGSQVTNLTGQATLAQCYALMRKCRLYIGNDTGPMHLAAAAGLPAVEICAFPKSLGDWNPNSPMRFSPWGVPHVVLQPQTPTPPCVMLCEARRPHCIQAVAVSDVIAAAKKLIEEHSIF